LAAILLFVLPHSVLGTLPPVLVSLFAILAARKIGAWLLRARALSAPAAALDLLKAA